VFGYFNIMINQTSTISLPPSLTTFPQMTPLASPLTRTPADTNNDARTQNDGNTQMDTGQAQRRRGTRQTTAKNGDAGYTTTHSNHRKSTSGDIDGGARWDRLPRPRYVFFLFPKLTYYSTSRADKDQPETTAGEEPLRNDYNREDCPTAAKNSDAGYPITHSNKIG